MARCVGKSRRLGGQQCKNPAIRGGTVCRMHGGSSPKTRAKAAIRAEVLDWGLGDSGIDPSEILLRLVSQSAARAQFYARLLQQAYDAAEAARAAGVDVGDITPPDVDTMDKRARRQLATIALDQISTVGGITALIGHTYGDTKTGEIYATGEAVRGLALLEAQERDRCAGFAEKAIKAGLAERQVKLAEQQGEMIVAVLRAVFDELGLSDEQRERVPGVVRRHLTAIAG